MRGRQIATKSHTLTCKVKAEQTPDQAHAEMMVEGVAANAVTAVAFSKTLGELDLTEVVERLLAEVRRVQTGDLGGLEGMLTAQTVVLNAVFTSSVLRTSNMTNVDHLDRFTRLGLKAQSQCRATVETLALMKNPPAGAIFARQANIANGLQQVNNGALPLPASIPARAGNPETAPNELLEAHEERLDSGTTGSTKTRDQALATVGALDRSKNRRRKGPRLSQC